MNTTPFDRFLADISPDSPCGVNLELDPDYIRLENEAKFIPERQMGNVIIPEKEPDWKKIRDLAMTLLERSRDIQVAMHLTCALIKIDGLKGFENGVTLINGLLQKYWDKVYPRQDPDDEYPVLLINTLGTLNDDKLIIEPLRHSALGKSKFGEFSWDQFESTRSKAEALSHMSSQEVYTEFLKKNADKNSPATLEEAKLKASADLEAMEAAFREADLTAIKDLAAVINHSSEQIQEILTISSSEAGSENAPNISLLTLLLKNLQNLFNERIKQKEAALAQKQSETEAVRLDILSMTDVNQRGVKSIKGNGIQSREEVILAIDGICKYFDTYEPSSPVPFLLIRAKKLLSMNFMEILQDLTPDAVNQAEKICGVKKTE